MKDNLQLDKIQDDIEQLITEGIDEVMEFAKTKLEEKTPEDTQTLLKWYEIQETKRTGTLITGTVLNRVPYGIYVEYGLSKEEWIPTGGRPFNYHKPKWVQFYRGVGARMVTKTYDQDQEEMSKILENKVKQL